MKLEYKTDMFVSKIRQFAFAQLIHLYPIDADSTPIGLVECTDNLQQCGLSRTTRSDDAHHLPFVDMQGDAFQYLQFSETLGDILDVNHDALI